MHYWMIARVITFEWSWGKQAVRIDEKFEILNVLENSQSHSSPLWRLLGKERDEDCKAYADERSVEEQHRTGGVIELLSSFYIHALCI